MSELSLPVGFGAWWALILQVPEAPKGSAPLRFHPSHPPGAACAPELLWILTGCDAVEKLCLSLPWVRSLQKAFYFCCRGWGKDWAQLGLQNPLVYRLSTWWQHKTERNASTSRCMAGCICNRPARDLLSPYLMGFVEEAASCLAGMIPGLHCEM